MFVRNLLGALARLHQWEPPGITRENWRRIDRRIRASRADRNWRHEVLNRAGVQAVITDNYTDPVMAVKPRLGASYFSVLRINGFAFGWDDRACDHNGNNGRRLLERLGIAARTFDDYMDGLETVVRLMPERGQVALKNALAYDRDLDFEPPDLVLARQAWGLPDPSPAARKAFGDFVVDRLCALAARHDIPVQIHLGTAVIRGSHPLKLASLVERHPRTQFLLMHLAYPWSRDLLGMAFVYRNIWLDLTWAPLLSPSHFKLALHEAIELLPDESRMMVGGDNWHVEETFGAIHTVRQCLADVLVEKVRSGYFQLVDAERLARKILRRNAIGFFHLPFSL